jgi:hypothetical protein
MFKMIVKQCTGRLSNFFLFLPTHRYELRYGADKTATCGSFAYSPDGKCANAGLAATVASRG